jgi:hypothetical protein
MAQADFVSDDWSWIPRGPGRRPLAEDGSEIPPPPPAMTTDETGNRWGKEGSGVGPGEGAVGNAPPQLPGITEAEPPRVEYGDQQPPSYGGGPSQAAAPRPDEPTPVAAQAPNPETPSPFTPMQDPLSAQQSATAAYPIQRRPIVPVTGQATTQGSALLGKAGGLLGGGLGTPGMLGTTQEHTDIGSLIANLYKMANQSTQTY